MRIFQIVKRITQVVSGGDVNWQATSDAGFTHDPIVTVSPTSAPAGFDAGIAPFSVRTAQSTGFDCDLVGATGTAGQLSAPSGFSHDTRATVSAVAAPGGFDIVRATYNLDGAYGSDVVTQEAVSGRTDWASISNAQGTNNGTVATIAGNAVAARNGRLRCDFANFTNKSSLTIDSVVLSFYGQKGGVGVGKFDGGYRIEGVTADIFLWSISGTTASNFMTSPRVHDLTSARSWTWADLDAFDAFFQWSSAVAETGTAEADAVILTVTASATETY